MEEKEMQELGLEIFSIAKEIVKLIGNCNDGNCSVIRTDTLISNECMKLQNIAEKMGVSLVD